MAGPSLLRRLVRFAVPPTLDTLRHRESILILLDIFVLAALALLHILFAPGIGSAPRAFFVVLVLRVLMETMELVWIRNGKAPPAQATLLAYSSWSIWIRIAFASVLSVLGGMQNSHYIALMVIPVVAAGFRYEKRGIALVVLTVSVLTFLYLYIYFRDHGPGEAAEYFEAANVVLIYIVVATSVAFLVRQLRRDGARLAASLTALEETRDRLVAEEKLAAVGRLSSAIAHEIRNPVGMIVSSLALVRDGTPERRDELCAIAMMEAKRLEALTTDFLSYARPRKLQRRPTSICGTVQSIVALVSAKAAEGSIGLSVECPHDRTIGLDPFQIHQALLNLVTNALDATPKGGRIVLGAHARDHSHAEMFVENTGPALAAGVVPRLFEPFFTTKPGGTGLGLAIAQGIARAHGGDVILESNAPGTVRFTLRLPADRPSDTPEREPAWHAY